jgi:hypothetical protein
MSRYVTVLALASAVVALGFAVPASAGVPRVVFGEDFTATWCTYCDVADCALTNCDSIFNQSGTQFISAETHGNFSPPDPFVTAETTARINRYAVTGYPTVQFDGDIQDVGAMPTCNDQIGWYAPQITSELSENGGNSPISITGTLTVNGNVATLKAKFKLLDPGTFTGCQATLFLLEDSIACCTGIHNHQVWQKVVRMVRSTPMSLTTVGQEDSVTQVYSFATVTPPVRGQKLHPVALFEQIGGAKTIIQASNFLPPDYSLNVFPRTASVPGMNGTALFPGTIQNVGTSADVVTLSIDNLFGWPADFQIQGDPNYYTSYPLALSPGQSKNITIRVRTDGVKRIGAGNFSAQSQNSGRISRVGLQVFNGSYAIMLVNNDNGTGYGTVFSTALNNLGYLFTTMNSNPGSGTMAGYDAVIWQTAYQSQTLSQGDKDNLAAYLDAGGRLYLSSEDFLSSVTLPDNFVTNYLGVASFTVNTHASSAIGVNGDPITNGMNMSLSWPAQNANRVDTVNPGTGATAIFFSETNHPAALRFDGGSFRTVFNTITQNAFPTGNPDPNNSQYDIQQTLIWLLSGSSSVQPVASRQPELLLQVGQNPARSAELLNFSLGASNAGVVHLSFLDAGGRLVRTIDTAPLKAGAHSVVWNLQDASGRTVPNGIYFAKLRTTTGSATSKVVVLH